METAIRWHGRAQHGTKTAVSLLSKSIVLEGRHVQAYPDFHCSHLGEPIVHYTRIRELPFVRHCPPVEPSVVLVLDADLIGPARATQGLAPGGLLLANTAADPEEVQREFSLQGHRVATLDGTAIAVDCLGEDLPNVALLGALVKLTGLVELGSLEEQIVSDFGPKMSDERLEAELCALHRGYEDVKAAEALAAA